ncbi:MAG: hypothetical protein COV75_01450 [Candidatus Omnitrophica bacterium CG11_big_fil_rev_8_21_14_0_20_63_9]|nr:MAG: hypothetical protein COV75_01450 [Candidatus Omnitrophica bacterium CG11_big_fil_rev_8_21_14_0_20_63_9]
MTPLAIPQSNRLLLERIGAIARAEGAHAYAVGGCVRDWLAGRAQHVDVDITVEGDGLGVAKAVARALDGRLQTHEPFGTATIELDEARPLQRIDIATCRRETYAKPAAYPMVQPGTLRDDLFRRDFSINAMAMNITPKQFGELIDPFGGQTDLRRRVLRVLHDRSFLDDPSRILRGVRFARRFGLAWDAHTNTLALEAVAAGALGWLNAGRLHKEFERMLTEPDPQACVSELARLLDDGRRHPPG